MSEVKFEGKHGGSRDNEDGSWFMVMGSDGNMQCSCGRNLERVDKDTFRCSAGFPQYRPEKGEVRYDKFGNIMIKIKAHK